jgi:hypothetical protein
MTQLAFDLAQSGAAAAAAKADRIHADWSDRAFEAFRAYAMSHATFTTEDVRAASPSVPAPPDARAWGRVALQAKGKGICEVKETARSRLKHAHCRHINVWQSNVYKPAAEAA